MLKFPANLYSDVRVENVFETKIRYTQGRLDETKVRKYQAAFIRVFDGRRWYYSSISDSRRAQEELNQLAALAEPNLKISNHPLVKRFQVHHAQALQFTKNSIAEIDIHRKRDLLTSYFPILTGEPAVKMWRATYLDRRVVKEIYSSQGTELTFDTQLTGLRYDFDLGHGERRFSERFGKNANDFKELENLASEFERHVQKCVVYLNESIPVTPGEYCVILSPTVAGAFAHESFGHKSEADFMLGDETMKKEWEMGKYIGREALSILDDGTLPGAGCTPYDDEGTKASPVFLIKDGKLAGRLHSITTAAAMDEPPSGNARAVSFEYEPIVRMTTTYISSGTISKEELFAGVKDGIFVETIAHGSGLSTFTLAPGLAYIIKDGKIAQPVEVAVITGNVFETLGEIDGLSNQLEIVSTLPGGGCGKNEQYPLPVSFGGPYVRVRRMNVQ